MIVVSSPTFSGEFVPQQTNGFDCGVFCITYADFLTEGFSLAEFSQNDMPLLRRKLGANILQVKIL
jgi:Ulp1 family protease